MDVFGLSQDRAISLFADASNSLLSEIVANGTAEQQSKYYGEMMLKANGYEYASNTGWMGGIGLPMSDLDIIAGGYNIRKNDDGSYTSSSVRQFVNRVSESFYGKQGKFGNSPDVPANYKGLDSTIFIQPDMYGAILDYLPIDRMQTIDVWNGQGRDQSMNTNYGRVQGNTIISDFTFQYNNNDNGVGSTLGTIINAMTLSGHLVGGDGRSPQIDQYRWLQEGFDNMSSDGCFIYFPNDKNKINNTFEQWGINRYTYIRGILNTLSVYKTY
jgi:hypothetical protein